MNKNLKTLEQLNLMDRFLFAEAMEDSEFAESILEIILGKDVLLKMLPQTEKEIRASARKKSIRLDVCLIDWDETGYDVEVQQKNTKDLPERSRYYQGMMDCNLLIPGSADYKHLPPVYIIMICGFDFGGEGLYQYTYEMTCSEGSRRTLQDGAKRIFLNTKGQYPELVTPELVELMRYMRETTDEVCEQCESEHIKKMHLRIQQLREDEEVAMRYLHELDYANDRAREARAEGRAEGREEGLRLFVEICREFGAPQEVAVQKLADKFAVTDEAAAEAVARYWK